MDMQTDPRLEFEDYDDDDDFYAELRRQILILTADDDDEGFLETKNRNSSHVVKRGLNSSLARFPSNYFTWWENENSGSTPAWLSNLWRSSNGTGVFIPRIVKSRRKQKPGRMNNEMGRRYTRVENKYL